MKPIIHETIQKCKQFKVFLLKNQLIIAKNLVFTIICLLFLIIGSVYEKVNSLRSTVEIIYPEIPKNIVVYLPESERISLLNRYNNMSNIDNITTNEQGTVVQGQSFVASKNGSRYYPVDCKSSSRIKPENKIYFSTSDDAQRAGFSLATGCSL
jgi:hypothetical protein